ncbi:MAG: hypothetical protein KC964_13285, partial [Candidatus Omnitrophica bacterium]|nr:hypothetical protein [Candidatus Omnitrophota bacterium]
TPVPSPIPQFDEEAFRSYVAQLKGGSFIGEVEIDSNVATIQYYASFAEYMNANPQSGLTAEQFRNYWDSGDAVEKALMENSIRLFKEFPVLNEVNIFLPYQEEVFLVSLPKSQAESFLGVDFQRLHEDRTNERWRQEVSNKYFNPEDRKRFIELFVTVQGTSAEETQSLDHTVEVKSGETPSAHEDAASDGYSIEYKLAALHKGGFIREDDPLVGKFRSHLDNISQKTGEEWIRIADMTVTAQTLMKQKGVQEDLLTTIQAIEGTLPDDLKPGMIKLEEIVSAYVVLRTGGR